MISWIWKSYLSPVYWLIRVFGHDTKEKDRDDIDADKFRLCLQPKTSVEKKKVYATAKHIWGKTLRVNMDVVQKGINDYFKLRHEVNDAEDDLHLDFRDRCNAVDRLNRFIAETFTVEVTEEEREHILDYLSKNKHFVVVRDEVQALKREAEHRADYERRVRRREEFLMDAINAMESRYDEDDEGQAA